jgi:hypothetical protein
MKTKNKLEEKKLSKAELEAREKVMKDLKKNKSALVKRYGKDAEAVMYGRATNIAKKMAESENKNRIKELVRKALMQEADIEVMADKYGEEKALGQASMMLDALEKLLKNHDWWYMMSDDDRWYRQGSAQQSEIRNVMKELEAIGYGEDAKALYNQYAPDGPGASSLKIKEGKKEDMDKDGDIDSKDYLLKRDAAIKKAKLKEYDPDQDQLDDEDEIFMSYDDEGKPLEEAYVPSNIKEFAKRKGATSLVNKVAGWAEKAGKGIRGGTAIGKNYSTLILDLGYQDGAIRINLDDDTVELYGEEVFDAKSFKQVYLDNQEESKDSEMNEDIDLGHQDNEPHMIKGELYQIGKYAMKLYATLEELEETGEEIDFPAWWQSKITTAKNMMSGAKHYLDFELKEPYIDAAVDAATGEEPHMGEPEAPMMEAEIGKDEILAGKIMKALKDMANKDASDQHNLKQARIALNKGKIEAAEKIAKPYLSEKIAKQLKSK